jgi:HEAT repeat protein
LQKIAGSSDIIKDMLHKIIAHQEYLSLLTPEDLRLVLEQHLAQRELLAAARLVERLNGSGALVRSAFVDRLMFLKNDHYCPFPEGTQDPELRKDDDPLFRIGVAQALGLMHCKDELWSMKNDTDPDVRRTVVKELAGLWARPQVLSMAGDEDSSVRAQVAESLTLLSDRTALRKMSQDHSWEVRRNIALGLIRLGDTEGLVAMIRDKHPEVSRVVHTALARLWANKLVLHKYAKKIRELLRNGSCNINDLTIIHKLSKDKDWEIRRAAAIIFYRLKEIKGLVAMKGDRNHEVTLIVEECMLSLLSKGEYL